MAPPRAIGLIDGVFERVLPVWHKEILWALARGVHVFGAASMGALRAAELHAFGMVGVGRIFAAYRDGELEADDEVAVLHGPAEVGFAPVTEALVNVRATLEQAQAERIMNRAGGRRLLLVTARAFNYRERSWAVLLDGLAEPTLAARLRRWLPNGRVDQKRSDALALLDRLAAFMATDPAPLRVDFPFAWTDAWDSLYGRAAQADDDQGVLDELRLQADRMPAVRRMALLRLLARRELERSGMALEPAALAEARERLRARLGLWRRADLDRWLVDCDLDAVGIRDAGRGRGGYVWPGADDRAARWRPALLAELRATGGYATLAERARAKALALAAAGLDAVPAAQAGVDLAPFLTSLAERSDGDASHRRPRAPAGLSPTSPPWSVRPCASCSFCASWLPRAKPRSAVRNSARRLGSSRAGFMARGRLSTGVERGGTRFRVYPQPPVLASYREPITVELSPAAGTRGRRPARPPHVRDRAAREEPSPDGQQLLRDQARRRVLPPWRGPIGAPGAAWARRQLRPSRAGRPDLRSGACLRLRQTGARRLGEISRPRPCPGTSRVSGAGSRSGFSAKPTTMARSAGAGSSSAMTSAPTGRRTPSRSIWT